MLVQTVNLIPQTDIGRIGAFALAVLLIGMVFQFIKWWTARTPGASGSNGKLGEMSRSQWILEANKVLERAMAPLLTDIGKMKTAVYRMDGRLERLLDLMQEDKQLRQDIHIVAKHIERQLKDTE